MQVLQYREADKSDIPGIAKIRTIEWETEEYWNNRITKYLDGSHNPQQALHSRIIYVATDDAAIAGFIAGHLTSRYECEGELEWINVLPENRRRGIASKLLSLLTSWFIIQKSTRVCVNVDPSNKIARNFYKHHGAIDLNKHWLIWNDIGDVLQVK